MQTFLSASIENCVRETGSISDLRENGIGKNVLRRNRHRSFGIDRPGAVHGEKVVQSRHDQCSTPFSARTFFSRFDRWLWGANTRGAIAAFMALQTPVALESRIATAA